MKRIYLDMDGVVTNYAKSATQLLGLDYYDPKIQACLSQPGKLETILANYGVTEANHDRLVQEMGYDYWYNIELFPWSHKLYDVLNSIPNSQLYFLSSPAKFHAGWTAKIDYIKHHFNTNKVVLTKFKYLLAQPDTVLIDDTSYNTIPFEQNGGHSILWPNQFLFLNNHIDIDNYITNLVNSLM